jgi:hypothetical protein
MRKRLITPIQLDVLPSDEGWLNLDREAVVEVTSEEKGYRDPLTIVWRLKRKIN